MATIVCLTFVSAPVVSRDQSKVIKCYSESFRWMIEQPNAPETHCVLEQKKWILNWSSSWFWVNAKNYDVYICAGNALDKSFPAQRNRSMADTLAAPNDTYDPDLSTQPRSALPVHWNSQGGGGIVLAGWLVVGGDVGCVCSKLPTVYSH